MSRAPRVPLATSAAARTISALACTGLRQPGGRGAGAWAGARGQERGVGGGRRPRLQAARASPPRRGPTSLSPPRLPLPPSEPTLTLVLHHHVPQRREARRVVDRDCQPPLEALDVGERVRGRRGRAAGAAQPVAAAPAAGRRAGGLGGGGAAGERGEGWEGGRVRGRGGAQGAAQRALLLAAGCARGGPTGAAARARRPRQLTHERPATRPARAGRPAAAPPTGRRRRRQRRRAPLTCARTDRRARCTGHRVAIPCRTSVRVRTCRRARGGP
jgi:hypothetical protein